MKLTTITKKRSRSEQSRINGAKSQGPITQEGKAKSSANALKHGYAAVINVVLQIEDKPAFELHLHKTHQAYKPRDYAEEVFVDQIASVTWRKSRLEALETALLDAQVSIQHDQLCTLYPQSAGDPYFHLAKAWQALARQPKNTDTQESQDPTLPPDALDINSAELLRRYQNSADRQLRNALLNLDKYRQSLAPQPPEQPTGPMEPEKNPEPQVGLETKCKISSVTSEPMDLPASPARQSTPLAPPVPLASLVGQTSGLRPASRPAHSLLPAGRILQPTTPLVGQTSGLRSAPSLANSQPDLPASPVPLPTLHPRSAQK